MTKPKIESKTEPKPRQQFSLAETIFRVEEAADFLRISRPFFYRLIKAGKLKKFKIGDRTLVSGRDLARYVDSLVAQSTDPA